MKVFSPQRRPRAEQGGSRTVLLWVGLCIAVMVIGVILRPLYWTIQAEVIHPFRSQGASSGAPRGADAEASPQDADAASSATGSESVAAEATVAASSTAQPAASQTGEATPAGQDTAIPSAGQDSVGAAGSVGAEPATAAAAAAGSTVEFREEDYQLTGERMRAMADENGYIVVTFGNFHYMDFILNWVYHVEAVGVKNYAVGAMDVEALRELAEKGLNTFSMSSGLTTGDFGWGTPTFHRMGRHKINLIRNMVQLGLHVVFCDVDTVWVRNPMPYMMQYPDADILTSSDHLVNTVDDEGLEKWPQAGSAANIGIMLFRPTTLEFVQEWSKVLEQDEKVWDQNAFNTLFRRGASPLPDDPKRLFAAYDGKLKMGILPVALFCSGHTFFVQKMHQKLGFEKPYVVHATFQYSGTPGKRNRFREQLLWSDGLDYFDHPVGFLSFDLDLPADLLAAAHPLDPPTRGLDNTWGHFNLTTHQLPQVFLSSSGPWTLPSPCVTGGPTLPFQCPLDHLLNLEKLANPSLNLGPHIDWRESSFLDNPRLPASVSSSRVDVHVCQEGEEGCVDGSASAAVPGDGKLRLAPNLTDQQLKTALAPLGGWVKILHFAEMLRVFKGHEATQDSNNFKQRTDEYTSLWCCVDAHPGHVHYDMWPHLVPHTDRFQREWTTLWYPTTGP